MNLTPEQTATLDEFNNLITRYTVLTSTHTLVSSFNLVILAVVLSIGIIFASKMALLSWPVYFVVQFFQHGRFILERDKLVKEYRTKFPPIKGK